MSRPVSTDRPHADTAKRGRLCSVELLPAAADAAVDAAAEALLARKATQKQIRDVLNDALLTIGCAPIASSSFNRWVERVQRHGHVRRSGHAVTTSAAPMTITVRCPHCGRAISADVETSARRAS